MTSQNNETSNKTPLVEASSHRSNQFYIGVLVGGLIGAAISFLTQQNKESEVRKDFLNKVKEIAKHIPDWIEQLANDEIDDDDLKDIKKDVATMLSTSPDNVEDEIKKEIKNEQKNPILKAKKLFSNVNKAMTK